MRIEALPGGADSIPGFELKREIGSGAMASAYLAVQHTPSRVVALKVLRLSAEEEGQGEDRETLIERFRLEGEILSRLDHPNIVRVHGVGTTGSLLYIYMEFVGGGDLAGRIASGVHPFEALDITAALAGALDYAHGQGIVHRDLKPRNILFRHDGTVLLADFGIAKRIEAPSDITTIGMLLGSPLYMSPEQVEGRGLDGRSDLYSLGVVLYEMLTGRPPFVASSPLRIMMMHSRTPPPPLPADLEALQSLLDRFLAKDPDDRFSDAAAALEALDRARSEVQARSARAHDRLVGATAESTLGADTGDIAAHLLRELLEELESDRLVLLTPAAVALEMEQQVRAAGHAPRRLSTLVGRDPAISAQLLRAANGAYYGARGQVSSLEQAMQLLGSQAEGQIAALIDASRLHQARLNASAGERLAGMGRQARSVSALARRIAATRALDAELAGLGGLLHNLGEIALLGWTERSGTESAPGRVSRLLARLERTVAARMVEQWQFPGILGRLVNEYRALHSPPERGVCELDAVSAAWLLSAHGDTASFIEAGAMQSAPVLKLDLDESDVLDLYRVLSGEPTC